MLLSEKAEALQEEVEELLKVPADIPGTHGFNEEKPWIQNLHILMFLPLLFKAAVI